MGRYLFAGMLAFMLQVVLTAIALQALLDRSPWAPVLVKVQAVAAVLVVAGGFGCVALCCIRKWWRHAGA